MTNSRQPREDGALEALVRRINSSKVFELKAQVGDRLEIELWRSEADETRTITEERPDGSQRIVEFHNEAGVPSMVLRITKPRTKGLILVDLSGFTEQEVLCLRDAIVRACELVRPITTQADQQAKEKMQNEGIPNARLYRPVPTIRGRDGSIAVYVEGVHNRPEDAAGMG